LGGFTSFGGLGRCRHNSRLRCRGESIGGGWRRRCWSGRSVGFVFAFVFVCWGMGLEEMTIAHMYIMLYRYERVFGHCCTRRPRARLPSDTQLTRWGGEVVAVQSSCPVRWHVNRAEGWTAFRPQHDHHKRRRPRRGQRQRSQREQAGCISAG
jgi:hypothetical protein